MNDYKVTREALEMYARQLSWMQRKYMDAQNTLKPKDYQGVAFLDKTLILERVDDDNWKLIYKSGQNHEVKCEVIFEFQYAHWNSYDIKAEEKLTVASWDLHNKLQDQEEADVTE
jgi:hypothetical protein